MVSDALAQAISDATARTVTDTHIQQITQHPEINCNLKTLIDEIISLRYLITDHQQEMSSLRSDLNKLSPNYNPLPMKTYCDKSTDMDALCPSQLDQEPSSTSVSKDESAMAPLPVAIFNSATSSTVNQDEVSQGLVTGSMTTSPDPTANATTEPVHHGEVSQDPVIRIMMTPPDTDEIDIRSSVQVNEGKSTFQAFCARVKNPTDLQNIITIIKDQPNNKLATHNCVAFRLSSSSIASDIPRESCQDDGENGAGGLLLRILQTHNIIDTVLVVSRWYGGSHIGQARFKCIEQCAK